MKKNMVNIIIVLLIAVSVGVGYKYLEKKLFENEKLEENISLENSKEKKSDEENKNENNEEIYNSDNIDEKIEGNIDDKKDDMAVGESEKENKNDADILSYVVKDSAVFAVLTSDATAYNGYSDDKKIVGNFNFDDEVEILKDRGCTWYKVKRKSDDFTAWVYKDYLKIPDDPDTNTDALTNEQAEDYINSKKYTSKTDNFIWVNIDRQKTYIFERNNNRWKLIKEFVSGTGLNISPTVRGLYEIGGRGDFFYSERFKSGAKYWTRFYGPYLFHSVTTDKKGNVIDSTLGKRVSNGCIRLEVEDAKWINENIKDGTRVYIN